MISSVRIVLTLLLLVSMGALAQGDTVIYDFQDANDPFFHFGTNTTGSGLFGDCGTVGNICATHTQNWTEINTDANAFGGGEFGPFGSSIDLSGFIGYSVRARFIRDVAPADPNIEVFTGLSPIKFGLQWDPSDTCPGSMNACSDLYAPPVFLTETFQTFTVTFADFMGANPTNNAQIKFLMLTGDFDPSLAPNKKIHSGDFNANSEVSGEDFLTWQRNAPSGTGVFFEKFIEGNANIDGFINNADLDVWQSQYAVPGSPISDWSNGVGRLEFDDIIGITAPLAAASAVPEPASCWLAALCGVLLAGKARRMRPCSQPMR